jgi:nucleoside-diphosphate-sugar epimerase
MKLLFTGASGFVGRNTIPLLSTMYEISTLGNSEKNNYVFDVSTQIPVFHEEFDVIIHAAGKAHTIPNSENEKEDFFKVNVEGTKNLCKGLEKRGIPKSFIFISTVAVYGIECGENITEDFPLSGNTPYALSKIEAEKFLMEWCNKNNVKLSILRPSLIAGRDAPGNLGAMVKGLKTGKYLSIKNIQARKSILMVDDIVCLTPKLIKKGGIYNICDDSHPTFKELEIIITKQLNVSPPFKVSLFFVNILAKLGDLMGESFPINSSKLKKITSTLTFSNEKAKKELLWTPLNVKEKYKI